MPTGNWASGYRALPVVPGEVYTFAVKVRGSAAASVGLYLRMNEAGSSFSGTWVTLSTRSSITDFVGNGAIPATWTTYEYQYTVPAGVYWVSPSIYNYGSGVTLYFDDVSFRKTLGGTSIRDDSITTNKIAANAVTADRINVGSLLAAFVGANQITAANIDSRGLSIKDASGNVILAAGSPLAAGNIIPDAGWLNSNVPANNTNFITNPTNFSSAFAFINGSVSALNQPDNMGGTTATLINFTSTPSDMYRQVTGLVAGKTYRVSVWYKRVTAGNFVLTLNNAATWDTGESIVGTASAGTWARIVAKITTSTGNINIHLGSHGNTGTQQQAGTVSLAFLQLEETTGFENSNIYVSGGAISGIGAGAGTVVDNTYAYTGQNLIPNSDQTAAFTWGTSIEYNPDGANINQGPAYASDYWDTSSYVLQGSTTRNIFYHQQGITAGGDNGPAGDVGMRDGAGNVLRIPVIGGERYVASAYIANHRCYAFVYVGFFDASDNIIAYYVSSSVGPTNQLANRLSTPYYNRAYVAVTAPSNATTVRFWVRKLNTLSGNTDSYIWIAAPQLERVNAGVNTPSPYQPGPALTTRQLGYSGDLNATYGATIGSNLNGQITSANASTFIASAAIGSAQIGSVSVGTVNNAVNGNTSTGGRVDIDSTSGGRIRIYDSSNVLRMKIGYLL